MSQKNPQVDFFFSKAKKWREEMERLRAIILETGLAEELKWGKPCYTFDKSNIVIIQGFKDYCAILFVKGSLLKDAKSLLYNVGANSQAAKQLRFTGVAAIDKQKSAIKAYIQEAIEVEKGGLRVAFKKTSDYEVAEEFQLELDRNTALKEAFAALTPGRQRGYLLYFSAAKQSKTRTSRVEKSIPRILAGKGFNES